MMKRRFSPLNTPYIIWALIFIIVPLFIVAYYALTDSSGAFTLDNLKELEDYKEIFITSIVYSLIATAISLVIAFPFAYFMSKCSVASQKMQMMLVMLPMWMNLLIRTYSWMNILEKNGIINTLLGYIGIEPITFLGTPGAVIFGMVYNYLPYMIIPIYTVLSKIDKSLYEAADDLGCSPFSTILKLVMPLSIPGIVSGVIMVFVPSVSTFYISQKLGGGKILLIGDTIDRQIQSNYNLNLGAALSLVLMVIILISMMIMNKFADSDDGGMIV